MIARVGQAFQPDFPQIKAANMSSIGPLEMLLIALAFIIYMIVRNKKSRRA